MEIGTADGGEINFDEDLSGGQRVGQGQVLLLQALA